jgi:hypothetical protein
MTPSPLARIGRLGTDSGLLGNEVNEVLLRRNTSRRVIYSYTFVQAVENFAESSASRAFAAQ